MENVIKRICEKCKKVSKQLNLNKELKEWQCNDCFFSKGNEKIVQVKK